MSYVMDILVVAVVVDFDVLMDDGRAVGSRVAESQLADDAYWARDRADWMTNFQNVLCDFRQLYVMCMLDYHQLLNQFHYHD